MRNPFPENEVFNRFLGLKNHFREFQTQESRRRTTEISQLARLIQDSGDKISFDLLGSVNFGMAEATSDVDMVLYLDCGHDEEATYENCPMWRFYESLLITSILREFTDRPYHIQVVDCINLFRLEKAILNRGFDDDIIADPYRHKFKVIDVTPLNGIPNTVTIAIDPICNDTVAICYRLKGALAIGINKQFAVDENLVFRRPRAIILNITGIIVIGGNLERYELAVLNASQIGHAVHDRKGVLGIGSIRKLEVFDLLDHINFLTA